MSKRSITFLPLLAVLLFVGCAQAILEPTELVGPEPIYGNSGKYMSPYTEDYVVAAWVEKGRNAKLGSQIGSIAGQQAGQMLMESVPLVGGMLGNRVGKAAGRKIALQMAGGEEYIKETSDLSFDSIDDLAVYMYVVNSEHADYAEVLALTMEIYPELQDRYAPALQQASKRAAAY